MKPPQHWFWFRCECGWRAIHHRMRKQCPKCRNKSLVRETRASASEVADQQRTGVGF